MGAIVSFSGVANANFSAYKISMAYCISTLIFDAKVS